MSGNFMRHLAVLWEERVYYLDENWDRLRTVGQVKTLGDGIEELTFLPIRQRMPAPNEQTHPEMKDPATAQFISSSNTVSDLCDFMNEPYRCNIQHEPAEKLGKEIKHLLRVSNNTYPQLFTDIVKVPSKFSILESRVPNKNPYFGYVTILDIHAYDNSILIAGGPIANARDWPKDCPVKEVAYSEHWSYCRIVAENIVLPSTIDNAKLGELIKAVWKAKKTSLASAEN